MNWREDKTLIVLAFMTVFFTGIVLIIVWQRPNDGQTYSVFTTLLTGFAGALTMHLKGERAAPAGSTIVTNTAQVVKTPPDAPEAPELIIPQEPKP